MGILTSDEACKIIGGLELVASEWRDGIFEIKSGDEDVHTANERRLTEVVGSVGGKLHTGRYADPPWQNPWTRSCFYLSRISAHLKPCS